MLAAIIRLTAIHRTNWQNYYIIKINNRKVNMKNMDVIHNIIYKKNLLRAVIALNSLSCYSSDA